MYKLTDVYTVMLSDTDIIETVAFLDLDKIYDVCIPGLVSSSWMMPVSSQHGQCYHFMLREY